MTDSPEVAEMEPRPPYPYFWRTEIQRAKTAAHRLQNLIDRQLLPCLRRWKHAYKSSHGSLVRDLAAARERIASLEREVESYEGMDRAANQYQEEVRRLERECDLLRDKWTQMEAYGFDSPKAVLDRLAALEQPCVQCRSHGRKCER